jgi:hypothetical protein
LVYAAINILSQQYEENIKALWRTCGDCEPGLVLVGGVIEVLKIYHRIYRWKLHID